MAASLRSTGGGGVGARSACLFIRSDYPALCPRLSNWRGPVAVLPLRRRRLALQRSSYPVRAAFARLRGERVLRRAEERATSMSPRRALFTASSLGKTFATCGSRTTTFVEARTRLAYLPRTNSPKSDRLYSGRSQSLSSGLPFFINFSLPFRCESGTNDSDSFATLSVGNNKQSSF